MIKDYFLTYWTRIISYPLCILTYLLIALLYDSLKDPILYASLIIACFYIVFLIIDYLEFRHVYLSLCKLEQAIETVNVSLPKANNLIETEYQVLLLSLQHKFVEFQNEEDSLREERNDYFTMWAHQIKTPIAAMHLLIDDTDLTDIKEQLFDIEEYVSLALHYLRADHISDDLVLKEYDLDTIVKDVIRHYSPLFIRKKLSLNYTSVHYQIVTDEKWLSFVIGQILTNALKYTNTGSISIYLQDKTLVIEDTGIGIDSTDLPRIFEKNYTGSNGRTNSKSSGMGLYLCKLVLDKLAHRITVESQKGVGTKVFITLEK